MSGRNAGIRATKAKPHTGALPKVLSWLFARQPVNESVATRVLLAASPETVWNQIMFYEEIPGQSPFPLRAFMPRPLRTDGDKAGLGAKVRCLYKGGDLVKRITAVEPQRLIQFEVIEQSLGVEGCVIALGGSYEIRHSGDGSEIALTTKYRAYLHPRPLWRPLERLVTSQLHKHILNGMQGRLSQNSRDLRLAAQCMIPQSVPQGGIQCTASDSRSHL